MKLILILWTVIIFLVLPVCNHDSNYDKSLKLLSRLEETGVLERCLWYEFNKNKLFFPPDSQSHFFEYDWFVIEVEYIALINSGELLIKQPNGSRGNLFLIAKDAKNIRYATVDDVLRQDTVFIKTDTIDIEIIKPTGTIIHSDINFRKYPYRKYPYWMHYTPF